MNDETARRLIPADELRAIVVRLLDQAEGWEAWEVAEWFAVTDELVRRRAAGLRVGVAIVGLDGDQVQAVELLGTKPNNATTGLVHIEPSNQGRVAGY